MILPFKKYLHDGYSQSENAEWLSQQTGFGFDEEMMDKIGRPFYEIYLDCTVDVTSGEVKVTGVNGMPLKEPVVP